tara:strand:- start:541 stop:1398 length:858 start_codon:yes stop_codon:yes gene_type:complete
MLESKYSSRLAKIYCEEPGQKKALAAYITLNRVPHPAYMRGNRPLNGGGVQLCAYTCPVLDINFPEFNIGPFRAVWLWITNDIPDFSGEGIAGMMQTAEGMVQIINMLVGSIDPVPSPFSPTEIMNAVLGMHYVLTGELELPIQDSNWPGTIFGSMARDRPIYCDTIYPGRRWTQKREIVVNGPFEPYNQPIPAPEALGGGFIGTPGTNECNCFCKVTYQYKTPANTPHHGGCIELKATAPPGSNAKCSVDLVGSRGAPVSLPLQVPNAPRYPKIVLRNSCGWYG